MNSTTKPLPISVLVPVLNEATNLRKCLESVKHVDEVFVVDSGSTDGSEKIVSEFGASFVQFQYLGGYPKKRQWGLESLQFRNEWVLMLDADEEMTSELFEEIRSAISGSANHAAYLATKGFHFLGKKFRYGGFSHSAILLMRPEKCRFEKMDLKETSGMDMEVHERVLVDGSVGRLISPLVHNDFKGLQAYIDRHNRYSSWEAAVRLKLLDVSDNEQITPKLFGSVQERRRWLKLVAMRVPFEPWLWFAYHYFFRLGILEGRRGLIACQQRRQYIANVRAKIYERRNCS